MSTIMQIIPGLLVLTFPLIFYWLYLNSLKKKSQEVIKFYTTETSILLKDINAWVKNFNIFERKVTFTPNPNQTTYDFYDCDLIVNNENLLVIGKTKILGKTVYLTPTLFPFKEADIEGLSKGRIVKILNILENNSNLELEFLDPAYKNPMTLVLKKINADLKSKIITSYNKS